MCLPLLVYVYIYTYAYRSKERERERERERYTHQAGWQAEAGPTLWLARLMSPSRTQFKTVVEDNDEDNSGIRSRRRQAMAKASTRSLDAAKPWYIWCLAKVTPA